MVLCQEMFPVSDREYVKAYDHDAGYCNTGVYTVPGVL